MCAQSLVLILALTRSKGQKILFHLNHPIAFVRVTGVVTSITDLSPSWTLFTLDDSSGRSIEVKIQRLPQPLAESSEAKHNTTVSNLNVQTRLGSFDIVIDGSIIDIGIVISAKGTLDEWRGERQLVLKRVQVVKSTAAEVQEWAKMADFKSSVLNQPWYLSDEAMAAMDKEAQVEKDKARKKEKMIEEYHARKKEKMKKYEEKLKAREGKEEQRRQKKEQYYNHGAIA